MAYHERVPVAPLRHELVDVHELLKEAEGLVRIGSSWYRLTSSAALNG